MPAMAFPYAALTNGTSTATFADGLGTQAYFPFVRGEWAPAIAPLRLGELGGRGPYQEVVEEFTIHIIDTTAANCLSRLNTLNSLLDQAERWSRGENVAQVTFLYAPQGSTTLSAASPLKYVVYGRAPGDETGGRNHVFVSSDFNDFGMMRVIGNVKVRFYRHGVGTQDSQNNATASTNNGARVSATLSVESVPSPTKISLTNFGYGNTATHKFETSLIAITDASEDIQGLNASTLAPATDYTSVPDAASNATANILRFTPTVTTERVTATNAVSGLTDKERVWAVYANVRNNSGATSFKLRVAVYSYQDNYTPFVSIPVNGGVLTPKWIFCGQIAVGRSTGFTTKLAITASAAAGTLDIERLCFVDVKHPNNTVFAIMKDGGTTVANVESLLVDHQLYSYPNPIIYPGATNERARDYQGKIFISTKTTAPTVILLGTGSANSSFNYWRQTSGAGAVLANVWTVTRERGYITPP